MNFKIRIMKGRLVIAGTGLQLGHITIDTKNEIKLAKKVLYLLIDPVTERYIQNINETAESMKRFYVEGKERIETYYELINYIL